MHSPPPLKKKNNKDQNPYININLEFLGACWIGRKLRYRILVVSGLPIVLAGRLGLLPVGSAADSRHTADCEE